MNFEREKGPHLGMHCSTGPQPLLLHVSAPTRLSGADSERLQERCDRCGTAFPAAFQFQLEADPRACTFGSCGPISHVEPRTPLLSTMSVL